MKQNVFSGYASAQLTAEEILVIMIVFQLAVIIQSPDGEERIMIVSQAAILVNGKGYLSLCQFQSSVVLEVEIIEPPPAVLTILGLCS